MMKIMSQILNRIKEQQKNRSEYVLFNSIPVFIKDKITNEIDINKLIQSLESMLPYPTSGMLKSVVVGEHPLFAKRKINAFYHDNILYVSNQQDDLNDMLDDIVHEYSHAYEEIHAEKLYSDGAIKDEFLNKRIVLERTLRHEGYDTLQFDFNNINFNQSLDNFLLSVVGYERFEKITKYGLFINPYAATSLREYFATGFEEYILGDHQELKTISPILYSKLEETL